MPCPTRATLLTALCGESVAEYCPRCRTTWREDLHVWLHLDPTGGDYRPRRLGPRSFGSEFRRRSRPT